jgi:arsenate reductase
MMRTSEPAFKARGLSKTDDEDSLISAMAEEPKLIERPIVFADTRAVIGRPPEAVLSLL